ncbi:MAG: hypothetical protein U0736_03060 [Gemmataceae bacterium]
MQALVAGETGMPREDVVARVRTLFTDAGVFDKAEKLIDKSRARAEAIADEIEPVELRAAVLPGRHGAGPAGEGARLSLRCCNWSRPPVRRSRHERTEGRGAVRAVRRRRTSPVYDVIPADTIPAPYRGLLVHEEHMTVTVEAYHGGPVDVRVMEALEDGDLYAREVLLVHQATGRVVQFGIVTWT